MQLTQEQEQVKTQLIQAILDPSITRVVLTGSAGTGKTTILKEVIQELHSISKLNQIVSQEKPIRIHTTATTNKAVNVLESSLDIPSATIHSFLGLIPDYRGLLKRKRDFIMPRLNEHDLVLIDECSYINYDLLDWIDNSVGSATVLYIGDDAQLAPVGLNHCPVFKQNYPTYELTKLIRQIDAVDIAELSKQLKQYVKTDDIGTIKLSDNVLHVSKKEFDALIKKEVANDTDIKVLAYTNNRVRLFNKTLFRVKYGRNHYEVGDVLTVNRYVEGISTDSQAKILDIQEGLFYGLEGTYYSIYANYKTIKVFVPKKITAYKAKLKEFYENSNYHLYTNLKRVVADLRPDFALTIHKSQGSTYDKVYIDLNDFRFIKNQKDLVRLLYVAVSRARHQVIFTGDIS